MKVVWSSNVLGVPDNTPCVMLWYLRPEEILCGCRGKHLYGAVGGLGTSYYLVYCKLSIKRLQRTLGNELFVPSLEYVRYST